MTTLPPNWQQLPLSQKIAQMIVVRASGHLFDHQRLYPAWEASKEKLTHWLQNLRLGGVILLGGSAGEIAWRTQQLQNLAPIPLFIAADVEEGVGQKFAGATWFPPPMSLEAIAKVNLPQAQEYATKMGAITAQESLAIGINWLLAPIVDVNNNPDNPVINIRAFGTTPELVSKLTTAFIQGAQAYPILTTAKHFPGHGDTSTDSHLDLPVLPHSTARLAEIELPPFESAIAAKVDSVMTAHLLIQEWDNKYPATLSKEILTNQLRQQMGFQGLIVTDALIMGGVTKYAPPEEVGIMAIEAGADVLLMPSNPELVIEAITTAIKQGRLSEARIDQSLHRIWVAKSQIFPELVNTTTLNQNPKSKSQDFAEILSQPAAVKTVDEILRQSLAYGGNLPLAINNDQKLRNLIVVDDLLNCDFLRRHYPAVAIPQELGYQLQLIDSNSLYLARQDQRLSLLQVFLRGNPFRGAAGFTPQTQEFYQELLTKKLVKGLIIYGSPYIIEWFQSQIPSDLPWIFSYGQMPQAQSIVCDIMFSVSTSQKALGVEIF